MDIDSELNYNSDDEISTVNHQKLLDSVLNLDKTQYVKKPVRTEPTLNISEFNLIKSSDSKDVHLNELLQPLTKIRQFTELKKKVSKIQTEAKPLPKPVEKPTANRIQRQIGFNNVRQSLNKWDAVIEANRASDQLVFPLQKPGKLKIETCTDFVKRFRIKSDLQKELEALDPPEEDDGQKEENEKNSFPLTLKEMKEKRKEAARLRAKQSYQEAKARRVNKIKSKKFHRIQRREKMKQQIKEFEILQKTNPEEALKKLEEIDKARALERMSLRHKSTGKWAQNKQVRAKYDKESRQLLAQQLAVSRDLTQKLNKPEESDSEPEVPMAIKVDKNNPWVNQIETSAEVADFLSGYRKYWTEKNKSDQLKELLTQSTKLSEEQNENKDSKNSSDDEDLENFKNQITELDDTIDNSGSQNINGFEVYYVNNSHEIQQNNENEKIVKKNKKVKKLKEKVKKKKIKKAKKIINGWEVEDVDTEHQNGENEQTIDDIFDACDEKIQNNINKKISKMKNKVLKEKLKQKPKQQIEKKRKTRDFNDLSFKKKAHVPDLDEGLIEESGRGTKIQNSLNVPSQKSLPNKEVKEPSDLDPSNFIKAKIQTLNTELPDLITNGDALDDDEDLADQQALIAEAFQGDDIVDEFQREKQAEIDKNKPKTIDLSLPGWGTWGGRNLKVPYRKRKRFLVKETKPVPRRDVLKNNVIIREEANAIDNHQVNDLPFPFTKVQDFEASIRAPIGNTFVPETAHLKLIQPAVVTKYGAIIEPMDEDQLLQMEEKPKRVKLVKDVKKNKEAPKITKLKKKTVNSKK